MKKEDLVCKNCIHAAERNSNKDEMTCRKKSPNGLEVKDNYGVIIGHIVPIDYYCFEGEWWEWYENNRDSDSLKIYTRRTILDLKE